MISLLLSISVDHENQKMQAATRYGVRKRVCTALTFSKNLLCKPHETSVVVFCYVKGESTYTIDTFCIVECCADAVKNYICCERQGH